MAYQDCKVYNDGSHYIAIPYVPNPIKRKSNKVEEIIEITEEENIDKKNEEESTADEIDSVKEKSNLEPKKIKVVSMKDMFDKLYVKYVSYKKAERKKKIIEEMLPYFETKQETENYVIEQLERKNRNMICRRVRLTRKVFLANFNYFCTFTYDDKLHSEETFNNKLKGCFKMLCHRKVWKYAGVWERAP